MIPLAKRVNFRHFQFLRQNAVRCNSDDKYDDDYPDIEEKPPERNIDFDQFKDIIPHSLLSCKKPKVDLKSYHRPAISIWKDELVHYYDYLKDPKDKHFLRHTLPSEFDIVIIGGGAIGSSISYWLRERARSGLSILVLDKDFTVNLYNPYREFAKASSALSVGGLRQQFSMKENIQMSMFGAQFIRNIDNYLYVKGQDPPSVEFRPFGYLTLASEKGAEILKDNQRKQREQGVINEILTPFQIKQRFPWLNTEGIALGVHGLQDEGWFDPWSFLLSVKSKAMSLGAWYLEAEPVEFEFNDMKMMGVPGYKRGQYKAVNHVVIKQKDGSYRKIQFSICILAAGCETGRLAKEMLYIDKRSTSPFARFEIPIERRKRYVYCFEAPEGGPGIASPMVIDPSGLYVRREGAYNNYICGCSPSPNEEPDTDNLDVDYDYFTERIWPLLAHRIPAFESLKLSGGWAGYYDYNTFDENGIVGFHPAYVNIFIASGFSGHGLQHAPAVGRGVMEALCDLRYKTINLKKFSFDRVLRGEPLLETEII